MDSNQTLQKTLTPDEYKVLQQGVTQDNERALQEGTPDTNKAVQESMLPRYPNWPTSKPGPMATPPPPGQRSINAQRSEQLAEVGYNQETGEPGIESPLRSMPDSSMKGRTGFDQLETAPPPKKRKERL
jgi:hypothetical protein